MKYVSTIAWYYKFFVDPLTWGRSRNQEAANRHEKVGKLENGIGNLKLDGTKLREENVSLKAEIEQLKFQLQWKHTSTPKTQQKNDCSSTTGWSCWKSTSFSQKCLRLPVKHFEDLGKNRFYSSINKACAWLLGIFSQDLEQKLEGSTLT